MNFHDLSESLRKETQRRIAGGRLTQPQLANLTGFRQAHISNFLNGRRALSLPGLDRLLRSQELEIHDLFPADISASAPQTANTVPLVSPEHAHTRRNFPGHARALHVEPPAAALNPPSAPASRLPWQRFVAVEISAECAKGMQPLLNPGGVATLDRHDTRLPPRGECSAAVYALWRQSTLRFSHVERHASQLVLRPHADAEPATLVPAAGTHVIGRVCAVFQPL